MGTVFKFALPSDDFDPATFAAGLGWTVDEAASLFDFHGRRYKLALVEDLTFEERMTFVGELTDEGAPVAETFLGRGVGEPYWAVGTDLIVDASNLGAPIPVGRVLVETRTRRMTARRPLISRPAGWLFSGSGVPLVPGYEP